MKEIRDIERRLEAVEDALAAAATGTFDEMIDFDPEAEPDALSAVEQGINMMVADLKEARERDQEQAQQLREALEITKEQAQQLEQTLEIVRNQQMSIAELSTPVLQLWEGVLAMPIIGVVDTRRSVEIMERLLLEVSERQSRYVILDITGVEVVDTKTADHFIKVINAAELLGASCLVSGIRPAVSQTLVEIGVDLSAITTVSNLKEALRVCLRRMGRLRVINQRED